MTAFDLFYLALIVALLPVEYFVLWPAFLRRSQADPGRARLWLWSGWMIELWTLVGAGVALWLFEGRPWKALRLTPPHGWRLWVGLGLVLAVGIGYGRTFSKVARSKRPKRIKLAHPDVERLAPHARSELVCWLALSLSAGFCEEFVYRGYLIWAFQPRFGLWGAAALALVVFSAAHAYQGARGVLAVSVVGGSLTLVVLICDSLLPAMALHAVVDGAQGLIAWLLFREVRDDRGPIAARAADSPLTH